MTGYVLWFYRCFWSKKEDQYLGWITMVSICWFQLECQIECVCGLNLHLYTYYVGETVVTGRRVYQGQPLRIYALAARLGLESWAVTNTVYAQTG